MASEAVLKERTESYCSIQQEANMPLKKLWTKYVKQYRTNLWKPSWSPIFTRVRRVFGWKLKHLEIHWFVVFHVSICLNRCGDLWPPGQIRPVWSFNTVWPASEFFLPKLECNIALKRNSMVSGCLGSKTGGVSLAPHSFFSLFS